MPTVNEDFSLWLDGAPVIQGQATADFANWLDGAPAVELGQGSPNAVTGPSGIRTETTTITFSVNGTLVSRDGSAGTTSLTFGASGTATGTYAATGSTSLTFGVSATSLFSERSATTVILFNASMTTGAVGHMVGTTALTFGAAGRMTVTGSIVLSSSGGSYGLGNQTLPLGTAVIRIERGRAVGSKKLARHDGFVHSAGQRNGVQILLRVPLFRGPMDATSVRDRLDTLRNTLAQCPARFYLYTDRYYRDVQPPQEIQAFDPTLFDKVDVPEITLVGPDPFLYDTNTNTVTWAAPPDAGTKIVTVGGNTTAQPILSFLVGGSGAITINWTITNQTTGEVMYLRGDVMSGNVIVVDTIGQTVTISGLDRKDLFDGVFLSLANGANTLSNTQGAIWYIASVGIEWANRYE